VVVGDKKMAIFNDVAPFGEKLQLYPQNVEFDGSIPILKKEDAEFVEHTNTEPLREECKPFPGLHPIQKPTPNQCPIRY
jgi:UDP-2-acetamido-3-amino-2,3-dideoxy-glucuronate N-acetyltransferase